jgi:hypothetical protein
VPIWELTYTHVIQRNITIHHNHKHNCSQKHCMS